MKVGLVGFQGSGKSSLFQLLTGQQPDPAKVHTGQIGELVVPDERFDKLVALYRPAKQVPAKIQLFDTPGLSRGDTKANAQRFGVIRESHALIHVIGVFSGVDPYADVQAFTEECVLADLSIVTNRLERLKKDVAKPRPQPEKELLQQELDALLPMEQVLSEGRPIRQITLTSEQVKVSKAFALLSVKPLLIVLNTSESKFDEQMVKHLKDQGYRVIAAPVGLEHELQALSPEDREQFAREFGLTESCKTRVARAIFEATEQITFYTCDEKEVHAWLLHRGETALDAAATIHTDLAKHFIRAEIMSTDDLLRLGSEKEVRAAGLYRLEGREYVMQDGDEIVVRANA
ncbi:MAG: ribosome-binding ATPase YchF [Planctomycetaceae bacterium]|nr:MAG: ribosome-binding ATPase YchF [Planctomycetaceae bacterium]